MGELIDIRHDLTFKQLNASDSTYLNDLLQELAGRIGQVEAQRICNLFSDDVNFRKELFSIIKGEAQDGFLFICAVLYGINYGIDYERRVKEKG